MSLTGDDTMKLWDMRMLKNPVFVASDLFNKYPEWVDLNLYFLNRSVIY